MIVIDTGPVVAAANRKDDYHRPCVDLLQGFPGLLLLPAPLITEIGYMLQSRAAKRAAELVEQYSDLPLGTADAIVIAIAERFRAVNIATLDRRHFSVVRPSHAAAFTLLP